MTVSVIIPTYNRADIVGDAIRSVLSQTYDDIELLVVDDHSEDDTMDAVQSFEDRRVRYLVNRRSKGAQGARNTGVEEARGEWIAFLDSDDIWEKNKVEEQVRVMRNRDVDAVYSGFVREKNERLFWKSNFAEGTFDDHEMFLYSNPLGGFSPFIVKKDVLIEVGGMDESLAAFQDRDIFFRVSRNYKLYVVSGHMVVVRVTGVDRISTNHMSRVHAARVFYDKYKGCDDVNIGIKCCMRSDIAHYALIAWDTRSFAGNAMYVIGSLFYCPCKVLNIIKGIFLKSKWVRKVQEYVYST